MKHVRLVAGRDGRKDGASFCEIYAPVIKNFFIREGFIFFSEEKIFELTPLTELSYPNFPKYSGKTKMRLFSIFVI